MNINKLLINSILLLFVIPSVLSQDKDVSKDENNLYYKALFASLEKMNKEWGHIDISAGIRTDYHNMIVEKNLHITEGLPAQKGDYRVEYLESNELIDRYKRLKNKFAILVVFPMVNEGERLEIGFNKYWISYENNRLFYVLSEWSKVFIYYDCEKREYVIDEVKLGGI